MELPGSERQQALGTLNCTFTLFMSLQLGRVWFAEKDVENDLTWENRGRSNKANAPHLVLAAAAWAGEGKRKHAVLEDTDLFVGRQMQTTGKS